MSKHIIDLAALGISNVDDHEIKIVAKNALNPSGVWSNALGEYVPPVVPEEPDEPDIPSDPENDGTPGLVYELSSDGTYYTCTGIGTATETDIVIANEIDGIPVKIIGSNAFYKCGLKSVVIGDSVTTIEQNVFYGCGSLKSITIPNSVTTIGDRAFYNTYGLDFVYYNGDIESWLKIYFDTAFSNPLYTSGSLYIDNQQVTEIIIPDTITEIKKYAFYKLKDLKSITIPNSVTSIGKYAFQSCSSLTSIIIPDSVTSIGEYAFQSCSSLTIYCESQYKKGGWDDNWNPDNRPVVWGYDENL